MVQYGVAQEGAVLLRVQGGKVRVQHSFKGAAQLNKVQHSFKGSSIPLYHKYFHHFRDFFALCISKNLQ
jgi:hypothetical protein